MLAGWPLNAGQKLSFGDLFLRLFCSQRHGLVVPDYIRDLRGFRYIAVYSPASTALTHHGLFIDSRLYMGVCAERGHWTPSYMANVTETARKALNLPWYQELIGSDPRRKGKPHKLLSGSSRVDEGLARGVSPLPLHPFAAEVCVLIRGRGFQKISRRNQGPTWAPDCRAAKLGSDRESIA